MQPFLQDGTTYWGGLHRELGLLMYDPRGQHRLADDKVRLYVVAERRIMSASGDGTASPIAPLAQDYSLSFQMGLGR